MTEFSAANVADIEIVVHGDLPESARTEAEMKIAALARYIREPILHSRIRLTRAGDPAVGRPMIAEVSLDVNGRFVRAQVAARTAHEAIDLVQARLRKRLARLSRHWEARRGGIPSGEPHEWRHGQEPTHRPGYFPRPAEQRRVVRHKAYELATATPDDAAFDMDLMGYDFHLFIDAETGNDAVIYRAGPSGYRVAYLNGPPRTSVPTAAPLTISQRPAPRLRLPDAICQLDETGRPFLFFADPASGRGRLLYRRYDGHYGLISPAT